MNFFRKKPAFGEELELTYETKDLDFGACVPMTENDERIYFTTSPIQLEVSLNSSASKNAKKQTPRLDLSTQDVVIVKMDKSDPEKESYSKISLGGSSSWRIANPADVRAFAETSEFEIQIYKITPPLLSIKPMIICMIKNLSNGAILQLQLANEDNKPLMAILNIKVLNKKQRTKWSFILPACARACLENDGLQKIEKVITETKKSETGGKSETMVNAAIPDIKIHSFDSRCCCQESEKKVNLKMDIEENISYLTVPTNIPLYTAPNTSNTDSNHKVSEFKGREALEEMLVETTIDKKDNMTVTTTNTTLKSICVEPFNSGPSTSEVLKIQSVDIITSEVTTNKGILPTNKSIEKQDSVKNESKCGVKGTDSEAKDHHVTEKTCTKKNSILQKGIAERKARAMEAFKRKKNKK